MPLELKDSLSKYDPCNNKNKVAKRDALCMLGVTKGSVCQIIVHLNLVIGP